MSRDIPSLIVFFMAVLIAVPSQAALKFEKKFGADTLKIKLYGFSQLEARTGDGLAKRADGGDDGLRFQAQRVRLGVNYYWRNAFGKLFLDFNQSHSKKSAGLPEMIKDAFVGYRFSDSLFVRLGMIKAPVGMMFTTPGWNLDIVERNAVEKGLMLERDMGLLVSGRFIGLGQADGKCSGTEMGHEKSGYGFGYDIGVFNPAERSKAVARDEDLAADDRVTGDALAYAARIHFDYGDPFHFEASYGVSQEAGGNDTEDYKVFNTGIHSFLNPLNLKIEYTKGENILGVKNEDQSVISVMCGFLISPRVEAVIKHYQAKAEPAAGNDSDLGNTYFGLNFYIVDLGKAQADIKRKDYRKLQSNRIQVNYVMTSQDDGDDWTGHWGYTDDAILVQWQYKF